MGLLKVLENNRAGHLFQGKSEVQVACRDLIYNLTQTESCV